MAHGTGAIEAVEFDPVLDPVDGSIDGRVSCVMVTEIPALVFTRGGTVDELLDGTDVDEKALLDPTLEISWSSYTRLLRNCSRFWPAGRLEQMGEQMLRAPSAQIVREITRALGDPVEVYELLIGPEKHVAISCLYQHLEKHGGNRVTIEYRATTGCELTREFCEVQKGYYAGIPTTMGFPKAEIDLVMSSQSARFHIQLFAHRNPVAKLWNRVYRFTNFLTTRTRLLEMIRQVNARYDLASRTANELADQVSRIQVAEERFTRCFDDAPVAMLICRASDLSVVDVNDKLLEGAGYSREEVMAWTPADMAMWANPTDKESVHSAAAEAGGEIQGQEISIRHRDGHEIVALLSSKCVELEGEACILWQAVDITERKNSERELQRVRNHLEDLVEERTRELRRSLDALQQVQRLASVGTLAAGVAHEINNPVASIRAASEFALMLEGEPDAEESYRSALETCVEQSERCGEIVRNILRFARGETGIRTVEDLRAIVIRSMRLVHEFAASKGADIETNICDDEIPVFVNSIEMEQVFVNVLRNAIEAGTGKTRIEVVVRRLATGGFVEIRDDGPGIEPDQIPFLFDPFYTTRQGEGGTGLGLSVAHGIVNAHGGAIRADSEVDHGTAIQIQIPLHSATGA